ncbi:MAG: hypothetical protein ACXWLO_04065 [Rhizomicrobium sp.]
MDIRLLMLPELQTHRQPARTGDVRFKQRTGALITIEVARDHATGCAAGEKPRCYGAFDEDEKRWQHFISLA